MKKTILFLFLSFIFLSCENNNSKHEKVKYKHVVKISHEIKNYEVTITDYSGGDELSRGAGGALAGGAVDYLLGGSGKTGAIVGGLLGASTAKPLKAETRKEMVMDIYYTITFNDSSFVFFKDICPLHVGDSIPQNNYTGIIP